MIPRNLPKLVTDALHTGWDVDVRRGYGPSYDARFRRFNGTPTETVCIEWWPKGDRLVIDTASINSTPAPYADCVRLIRSKENPS